MPMVVRFGCFEVDLTTGELYKRGVRLRLREQSFQVLRALLDHPGEVVTREDLRRTLWPDDVFVDFENGLNTAVGRLREALGESAEHPRFIETLPRRGYRLLAPVSPSPTQPAVAGEWIAPQANPDAPIDPAGRGSCDPIAFSDYIVGRRHLDAFRTCHEAEQARIHLERAVARDPAFAEAYEALAQLCWFQGYLGLLPPREAFAVGLLHATRALKIDNTRAEIHALLAQYRKQLDYDWPDIERELARALEMDPTSSSVRCLYAVGWLMPQGRLADAIAMLEGVLQRDPLSNWANVWLAVMLALARDWDRTLAHARMMMEMDPTSPWGPWLFGIGCRCTGQVEEAIAAHRRAVDLSGEWPFLLGWLGLLLGSSGRTDEARGVLDRLRSLASTGYVPPSSFAWVHLGLCDVDRAFEWLDRAIDARDQLMMPIKTYVFFDPVRHDPRFATLLRKMNLASASFNTR